MSQVRKTLAVVGAGLVGTAFARLLAVRGYEVTGVWSRSRQGVERSERAGFKVFGDAAAAAAEAEVVLVTVRDDAVHLIAREIAEGGAVRAGQVYLHTSGSQGVDALAPLASAGALVGAIHPLQTFAAVDAAIELLPGSYFGVTAEGPALEAVEAIVSALGGTSLMIPESERVTYHLSAVLASNCFVALVELASLVLVAVGVPEREAQAALLPLVAGTLRNIESLGIEAALTGPVARGDAATVAGHARVLARLDPRVAEAYASLSDVALDLARARGLGPEIAGELAAVLAGVRANAAERGAGA